MAQAAYEAPAPGVHSMISSGLGRLTKLSKHTMEHNTPPRSSIVRTERVWTRIRLSNTLTSWSTTCLDNPGSWLYFFRPLLSCKATPFHVFQTPKQTPGHVGGGRIKLDKGCRWRSWPCPECGRHFVGTKSGIAIIAYGFNHLLREVIYLGVLRCI